MTPERDAIARSLAEACGEWRKPRGAFRSALREGARTFWLRHGLEVAAVCAVAAVSAAACRALVTPDRPVTAFVYTYPFGKGAGLRAWRLDGHGRWHERDADGREARLFDVTTRTTVGGCRGASTADSRDPGFAFFVPDAGCRTMALMIRRGGDPWSALGSMSVVSTEPARGE